MIRHPGAGGNRGGRRERNRHRGAEIRRRTEIPLCRAVLGVHGDGGVHARGHPTRGPPEAVVVQDGELVHRQVPVVGHRSPTRRDVAQGEPDWLGDRLVGRDVASGLEDLGMGPSGSPRGRHRRKPLSRRPLREGVESGRSSVGDGGQQIGRSAAASGFFQFAKSRLCRSRCTRQFCSVSAGRRRPSSTISRLRPARILRRGPRR